MYESKERSSDFGSRKNGIKSRKNTRAKGYKHAVSIGAV